MPPILPYSDETIAAIATPPGPGGIGIIRVSGPAALAIADGIFRSRDGRKPSQAKSFTVRHGWIIRGREMLDEVLLTVMRAPKSYTCEDVVEISCHGGPTAVRAALDLVLLNGARLAEPGEFTKRAFLNGRIDLTQAEAVMDIVQAKTEAFLRVSAHQLKGELTVELELVRERLMDVYTRLEAALNFPEDDIETQSRPAVREGLVESERRIGRLLSSGRQGMIMKDGLKVVLCGRPNVGKSSLLNALLKQPRAIVSEIAGTTRDTIEESAHIQGFPLQLIDTAGILEPRDTVEEEAVRRSRSFIQGADLVLLIIDASEGLSADDVKVARMAGESPVLVALNKCDLACRVSEEEVRRDLGDRPVLRISALQRTGLDALQSAMIEQVLGQKAPSADGIVISNVRHLEALRHARDAAGRGVRALDEGLSFEAISEEIKEAVRELDAITGREIDADLIDRIFSGFCIGK